VRFEWDPEKNESNLRKHGFSFDTASLVFEDPNCLIFLERIEAGEPRFHTYKEAGAEDVVRIVSRRRANSHERRQYAAAIL